MIKNRQVNLQSLAAQIHSILCPPVAIRGSIALSLKTSSVFLTLIFLAGPVGDRAFADNLGDDQVVEELSNLGIEELLDMTVTSISRKEEKLSEAASAVFVITAEDIRRSTANTIPELLRFAPGLSVARVNSHDWAITARGFNGQFANKLLVLIDGRSIYSPVFSGVFWEAQDLPLSNIERIEVIRGPGATIYGANAFNGVINIISKSAAKTKGTSLSLTVGTEDRLVASGSFGFGTENSSTRVFLKGINRDAGSLPEGADANDEWRQVSGGFRHEHSLSTSSDLIVEGGFFDGKLGGSFNIPDSGEDDLRRIVSVDRETEGQYLLGRLTKRNSSKSDWQLQTYLDRERRKDVVNDSSINRFDVDFQHRYNFDENNELIWGLGYSLSSDELGESELANYLDTERNVSVFSAFVQDKFLLSDEAWLIAGSKFEHNDFTGFEYQPSLKFVWAPIPGETYWAGVSRVVRTPSRINQDVELPITSFRTENNLIVENTIFGSRDTESEVSVSYEIGYRKLFSSAFSMDVSLFYNDVSRLITFEPAGVPELDSERGILEQSFVFDNQLSGESTGVELVGNFQPASWLELKASYSFLNIDLKPGSGSRDPRGDDDEGRDPEHQAFLQSRFNLGRNWEFDSSLRYVDELEAFDIDDYLELDLRLSWSPAVNTEVSLVGKNLLESSHREFGTDFVDQPAYEVDRGVFLKISSVF